MSAVQLVAEEVPSLIVDTCTLNNAMNAVQIAILLAILKWVRGSTPQ